MSAIDKFKAIITNNINKFENLLNSAPEDCYVIVSFDAVPRSIERSIHNNYGAIVNKPCRIHDATKLPKNAAESYAAFLNEDNYDPEEYSAVHYVDFLKKRIEFFKKELADLEEHN